MNRLPHPRRDSRGIALLMVITAITILALVLVEFSTTTRTHLDQGVNLRDEARAVAMADTAMVMSKACLDPAAWGPLAALQSKLDLERLCNLLLGIFIRGRVDLPIGGLSVELDGIEGIGVSKGDVEEIKLTPEEAYIGLAGLHCPNRAQQACGSRVTAMTQLRSLLCDPSIAHLFEKEQTDGHRYTRFEVIGNLIDWIDADDSRIYIDPATGTIAEGAGEGEDAYLKGAGLNYRSKDAPFDSVEELRLIRGIDDQLFTFLRDKVSVHSSGKINVNGASAEVISSLLQSASPAFQQLEASACGADSDTPDLYREFFLNYARIIIDARKAKQSLPQFLLSKPFKSPQQFIQIARDPLQSLQNYTGQMGLLAAGDIDVNQILMGRYRMTLPQYQAISQSIQWNNMSGGVRTDNELFRLNARGRVGDMTRRLFAVLKREGTAVRTLYYRED